MAMTPAQLLEAVEKAIEDILTKGQSISISGRTLTKADLRALLDEQKYLRNKIDRLSTGTRRVVEF